MVSIRCKVGYGELVFTWLVMLGIKLSIRGDPMVAIQQYLSLSSNRSCYFLYTYTLLLLLAALLVSQGVNAATQSSSIVVNDILSPKHPGDVAIHNGNATAVIVQDKGESISLLSLPDGSLLADIPTLKHPIAVALDETRNLALVIHKKDQLSVIDLVTKSVIKTLDIRLKPVAVAMDVVNRRAVVVSEGDLTDKRDNEKSDHGKRVWTKGPFKHHRSG